MTSSENVILPKDPKDTDSWDLYGKYKQYASPVIKTISNKKVLSPEERKEDILTFIKKSYIPSIGNIVTESYTKTGYYALCLDFLGKNYSYPECYSLEPFYHFYTEIFNDPNLKETFVVGVFNYLAGIGADLTKKFLPKNKKEYWQCPHKTITEILPNMNIPCQVQLTKMLIYVFVKYLQDNPDYFEEVVQWRKEELDKYYEYIDEQCKKEAESRRKQQEEDFGNEYECEQQEEGLEDGCI